VSFGSKAVVTALSARAAPVGQVLRGIVQRIGREALRFGLPDRPVIDIAGDTFAASIPCEAAACARFFTSLLAPRSARPLDAGAGSALAMRPPRPTGRRRRPSEDFCSMVSIKLLRRARSDRMLVSRAVFAVTPRIGRAAGRASHGNVASDAMSCRLEAAEPTVRKVRS